MTTEASRFVGSIPENYDHGLGPHIFVDYANDLARRAASLEPSRVLELAAGTGILTRLLRDTLPEACELVASDLNPPMLEVARAKFAPPEHVHFEQVDAGALQFEDASFDVVACQFGVMFFPDKARSYAEVLRVLRPAGSYLFNTWGSLEDNPFARIAHEVATRFFPENPPAFYQVPFSYHDADEIRSAVLDAGFATATVTPLTFRPKILSAARFAQGLVFGNPLIEEIGSRGGDPAKVRDAIASAIETELGSDMPLRALVVHATTE